jgi:hypothetical protein
MKNKVYSSARITLLSEYLFILLPFIVIGMVKLYKSSLGDFFAAADWSFASAILFGQAIVKIVSAGVINKNSVSPRIVLIVTLLFIIGVAPCLVLIAIILLNDANSIYIMLTQVILYIVATSMFFWIGSAAHVMIDEVLDEMK